MEDKLIDIADVKSVFKRVGIEGEECNQCMRWTSPALEEPLTNEDMVLVELTPEEQGFFHCMGYAYEEKDVDSLRMRALYETFWGTVRSLHNLPLDDLVVKEGKYIVAM
jgi:hypothetical protein